MRPLLLMVLAASSMLAQPQATGSLRGKVTLGSSGQPLHHTDILLPTSGLHTRSAEDGTFEFRDLRPGTYEVVAHMHNLTDARKQVTVAAGQTAEVAFELQLSVMRQEMTVTASGHTETTLDTVPSVVSVTSMDLQGKGAANSLGELLEDQAGIAKRSFGPGTGRPVVRGFDGDRVLVLEDGIRTGTLSSQSGDHGEMLDGSSVERVEVVKGPATLLYGSNAIGGVVNSISNHHHMDEHPHDGLRGRVSGVGGSANGQVGGSGGFEYGRKSWLLWGGGGGARTGDYHTPAGVVENSGTRLNHANTGVGRYGKNSSFSFAYGFQDGRYGIPVNPEEPEPISLDFRRQQLRFSGTIRDLAGPFEQFRLRLNYTDWNHKELEDGEVANDFSNKQFIWRGELEQRRSGPLSGTIGFWGMRRDYKVTGEEAISPPVAQSAVSVFALEQFNWDRLRVQFGGRIEHNSYTPNLDEGYESELDIRNRTFTGLSGGAGLNYRLWSSGAFVANYTHSYRAPALEELYNYGPHPGNVTFEVGDPNLMRESSDGFDLALRHQGSRFRAELNWFYYRMNDFVYLQPLGEVEDGLPVAAYLQSNSRFTGYEAKVQVGLHSKVWLNLSTDYVDAELKVNGQPLPRIPPLRGRVGLDLRWGGLSVRPELAMANGQGALAPNETRTAGYAVPHLMATYTLARQHTLHVFGVNTFNLSDRLYRNHLSFIKEYAPEIGRGVRVSYTLQWF